MEFLAVIDDKICNYELVHIKWDTLLHKLLLLPHSKASNYFN